jgi:hypothetical protein
LPARRICWPFSTPAGSFRSIVLPEESVIRWLARVAASTKGT